MNYLLKEYGMTLLYAVLAVISLFFVITFAGIIFSQTKYIVKDTTYSSDVYDSENVPTITVFQDVLEIEPKDTKYKSDEILNTLISENIVAINGADDISIYGKVNIKQEGTYNLKIVALNGYGKSVKNMAVVVKSYNHLQ
jgi:hypothetical protein